MSRAVALVVATIWVGGLLLAGPAGAQDEAERIAIRSVDATDPGNVQVTFGFSGDRGVAADATIRQDGRIVDLAGPVTPLDESEQLGVVLLIDSSGSMEANGLIARVLAAARAFVEAKAGSDQVAIATFDNQVEVLQEFTTNETLLLEAIDEIALDEETHLYDGIVRAASLFADSTLQPNVVVFSDGQDFGSTSSFDRAKGALQQQGAALFAMGVPNSGFGRLEQLATETGGTSALADDPGGVGNLFEEVQETLRKQYVASFASETDRGPASLQLTVGTQQAVADIVVGSTSQGAASLEPKTVSEPGGPSFLRSGAGLALVLVLVIGGVGLLIWNLGNTFLSGQQSLSSVLQPYEEGHVSGDDVAEAGLSHAPILQRAVELTGQFAERQGVLTRVEKMLERANVPLRPAELLFFYGIAVVVIALVALVFAPLILAVGLTAGAVFLPIGVLGFMARRRRQQFESQLPDTLQLLSSTLRAGYSLMQGVEAVSQETAEPMGRELRRVVTEARLGRPLEESLDSVAERMDSPDFAWSVMAIRIQREVGGNLSELLLTVADTMTERERLRRDIDALTAEGRVSAMVLALLPVGLGLFVYSINPDYIGKLFEETAGTIMLAGAAFGMVVGFIWMKKTIDIQI